MPPVIDMTLVPVFPVRTLYDPANAVQGVDANTSQVALAPNLLQVSTIPVGTTAEIQARLSPNAEWVKVGDYDSTNTPALFEGSTNYLINFMRVVRSVGSGNFTVYAQGHRPDC